MVGGIDCQKIFLKKDSRIFGEYISVGILSLGLFTQSNNYWSSTTNPDNTDNAMNVNFNNGNVNNNNKNNTYYVRCVRG